LLILCTPKSVRSFPDFPDLALKVIIQTLQPAPVVILNLCSLVGIENTGHFGTVKNFGFRRFRKFRASAMSAFCLSVVGVSTTPLSASL
jgi:hypothetical protein